MMDHSHSIKFCRVENKLVFGCGSVYLWQACDVISLWSLTMATPEIPQYWYVCAQDQVITVPHIRLYTLSTTLVQKSQFYTLLLIVHFCSHHAISTSNTHHWLLSPKYKKNTRINGWC